MKKRKPKRRNKKREAGEKGKEKGGGRSSTLHTPERSHHIIAEGKRDRGPDVPPGLPRPDPPREPRGNSGPRVFRRFSFFF
jgi:hypothetical protein